MSAEVFLDAAYAIALASRSDRFHLAALRLAQQLQQTSTRLVTTHAVLLEIGNALAKLRYRQAAVTLLSALALDANVKIIPLSPKLYTRAFTLYQERADKEWGLTDCISFVVMQDRHISAALTTDLHFQQAGFRALLREDLP